jgi:serine/threonine protein phosphatase PrpC
MSYTVYHARARGESHKESKPQKPCQDFAYSFRNKGTSLIAVADGHGGERYFRSERGSKFAVEAVIKCIAQFTLDIKKKNISEELFDETFQSGLLAQLAQSIVGEWRRKVAEDFKAEPFSEYEYIGVPEKYRLRYRNGEDIEKAYGTTLLAVLQMDDLLWLGLHIGDGRCVTIDSRGEYSQPIPWDEKCFLNRTTSLCGDDAESDFRFRLLPAGRIPLATFIASDGIDDSFSYANDFEQLYQNFYRNIVKLFISKPVKSAKKEIKAFLPVLSQKGSRDDMSVALMMDIEPLRDLEQGRERERERESELEPELEPENVADDDAQDEPENVDEVAPDIVEILWEASEPGNLSSGIKFKKFALKIRKLFRRKSANSDGE